MKRGNESDNRVKKQEALNQLEGLYQTNPLVGSPLPTRPQQVDFGKEQRMDQVAQERLNQAQGTLLKSFDMYRPGD